MVWNELYLLAPRCLSISTSHLFFLSLQEDPKFVSALGKQTCPGEAAFKAFAQAVSDTCPYLIQVLPILGGPGEMLLPSRTPSDPHRRNYPLSSLFFKAVGKYLYDDTRGKKLETTQHPNELSHLYVFKDCRLSYLTSI